MASNRLSFPPSRLPFSILLSSSLILWDLPFLFLHALLIAFRSDCFSFSSPLFLSFDQLASF